MRAVRFVEPDHPDWIKWKKKGEQLKAKHLASVQAGEKPKVTDHYKGQKNHFRDVAGFFGGRCAYCEQIIRPNQYGDIEHYRPKAAVLDEDWNVITREFDGVNVSHPGYFWLAYDPQNLLLSCDACNKVSEGRKWGKGNRFPVDGDHLWHPNEEANERPKLLNPVEDHPSEHMIFVPETGDLVETTERGRATIEILGLNLRGLPDMRADMYANMHARFEKVFGDNEDGEDTLPRKIAELLDQPRSFRSVTDLALLASIEIERERQTIQIKGAKAKLKKLSKIKP